MMVACPTEQEKKQRIIDIYTNQYHLIEDKKFDLDKQVLFYYTENDASFFLKLLKLESERMIYNGERF